ncbi:hypothetical protein EDD22DRAFT_848644 [Suillus occidentalis]|nr:hypothetical protein EDD22DRAFT_848644 [Suillus occidentalis]
MELSGSSTGPMPIRTLTYSANNLLCLLEDSADDLMQMLENNMPLTPTLHALHEYMFLLGYGQGALADNAITQDYPLNPSLPTPSPTAMLTPMHPHSPRCIHPSPRELIHAAPFPLQRPPPLLCTLILLHLKHQLQQTLIRGHAVTLRSIMIHTIPQKNFISPPTSIKVLLLQEGSPLGLGLTPIYHVLLMLILTIVTAVHVKLRICRAQAGSSCSSYEGCFAPLERKKRNGRQMERKWGRIRWGRRKWGKCMSMMLVTQSKLSVVLKLNDEVHGIDCPLDNPRISCSDQATTIIAELAAAHCLSSIHDLLRWLQDIGNFVQVPSVDNESLLSLVVRCRGMMGKDIRINFMIMINFMTACFIRLKTGLHLKGIYENEVKDRPSEMKVTYRTFLEWHATGSKFIAIACGGSIYALVLIAGLGLRVSIASMVGTTHLHLADMLRSPPRDSPQRKLILEHIVPTIARMRLSHPFSMTSMFSCALIERFSISKDIDCMDFSASDQFFDAIIQNELYGVGRPYSPPLSDIEEDEIAHVVIDTAFDPSSAKNKCFKPPRDKLKTFHRNGVKKLPDLRNKDGLLMAFVSTALPTHIHASLEVNLLAALRNADLLGDMDTRLPGGRPFQAMHLSWYNRHCTLGLNAPTDVQPWLLEKEGMRTNHGQVIPYISQDLQQHRLIYGTISKVYGELFEWVRQLMENYLQEEFKMLMEVASVLPGNALPPIVPFISLVININVAHQSS